MHINEKKRAFLRISSLFAKLFPILFWVLLIYGFDEPYAAGLTILSAAVHEGGHLLMLSTEKSDGSLSGALSGMRIRTGHCRSYFGEIGVLLAGPFANLVFCLLGLTLMPVFGDYALHLALINLFTALSNLLPVRGHDGYRTIRFILEWKESPALFFSLLDALSFSLTAFFSLSALYFMEKYDAGYWVWALFTFAMLSEIKEGLGRTKNGVL